MPLCGCGTPIGTVTVAQRAAAQAAEARAEIGAARAEHRQHVDAARDRHITAHAALRRAQRQFLSRAHRQAPPRVHELVVQRRAQIDAR